MEVSPYDTWSRGWDVARGHAHAIVTGLPESRSPRSLGAVQPAVAAGRHGTGFEFSVVAENAPGWVCAPVRARVDVERCRTDPACFPAGVARGAEEVWPARLGFMREAQQVYNGATIGASGPPAGGASSTVLRQQLAGAIERLRVRMVETRRVKRAVLEQCGLLVAQVRARRGIPTSCHPDDVVAALLRAEGGVASVPGGNTAAAAAPPSASVVVCPQGQLTALAAPAQPRSWSDAPSLNFASSPGGSARHGSGFGSGCVGPVSGDGGGCGRPPMQLSEWQPPVVVRPSQPLPAGIAAPDASSAAQMTRLAPSSAWTLGHGVDPDAAEVTFHRHAVRPATVTASAVAAGTAGAAVVAVAGTFDAPPSANQDNGTLAAIATQLGASAVVVGAAAESSNAVRAPGTFPTVDAVHTRCAVDGRNSARAGTPTTTTAASHAPLLAAAEELQCVKVEPSACTAASVPTAAPPTGAPTPRATTSTPAPLMTKPWSTSPSVASDVVPVAPPVLPAAVGPIAVHVHTGASRYRCPHCSYSSLKQTALREHILAHDRGEAMLACSHCAYTTTSAAALGRHAVTGHPDVLERELWAKYGAVDVSRAVVPCADCHARFETEFQLRKHRAVRHDDAPAIRKRKCPFCDFSASLSSSFRHHVFAHVDGEAMAPCGSCGHVLPVRLGKHQCCVDSGAAVSSGGALASDGCSGAVGEVGGDGGGGGGDLCGAPALDCAPGTGTGSRDGSNVAIPHGGAILDDGAVALQSLPEDGHSLPDDAVADDDDSAGCGVGGSDDSSDDSYEPLDEDDDDDDDDDEEDDDDDDDVPTRDQRDPCMPMSPASTGSDGQTSVWWSRLKADGSSSREAATTAPAPVAPVAPAAPVPSTAPMLTATLPRGSAKPSNSKTATKVQAKPSTTSRPTSVTELPKTTTPTATTTATVITATAAAVGASSAPGRHGGFPTGTAVAGGTIVRVAQGTGSGSVRAGVSVACNDPICRLCGWTLPCQRDVDTHMSVMHPRGVFSSKDRVCCNSCGYSTTKLSSFAKHQKKHTKLVLCRCCYCCCCCCCCCCWTCLVLLLSVVGGARC